MSALPLILGASQCAALAALRDRAARQPVQMAGLAERLATPAGKRAHMDQMNDQTVEIPAGYLVTYSVEIGHPGGTARHMSMSSPRKGKVPTPEAVWMVAAQLGFGGGIEACQVWPEALRRGSGEDQITINVVQRVSTSDAPAHA